jgi:hypothetical protein
LGIPFRRLPAGFAAAAAAAAATTPGSPATAAAPRPPATAAAEASAAGTTAAEASVGFRTCFVHIQCTTVQGVTVESGNGLIRLAFILHLDECETAGTAGFTICHDSGTVHLAVAFKEAADTLFGGVEIQVAYEYVLHSILLSI